MTTAKDTKTTPAPHGKRMAARATHKCPERFIEFLDSGKGLGQHFHLMDPTLTPAHISKFRHGILPISFEFAVRLEKAQKHTVNPFKAEDIVTDPADVALIKFLRGEEEEFKTT